MASVTNTTKTSVSLCVFAERPNKKAPPTIERIDIAPGSPVEVEDKFLASPGAKAMVESGKLEVAAQPKLEPKPKTEIKGRGKSAGTNKGGAR